MADSTFEPSGGTISPEAIVVKHFMEQISLLPQTWMSEGGFDTQKFNLQIGFLIRHLPDRNMQEKAMRTWDSKLTEYNLKNLDKQEITAFAGMEVVTELMQFVYEAFDLINFDIVGPATTRMHKVDPALEVPDYEELIKPILPKPKLLDDGDIQI